ncbi:MAG TPA: electron transport complex subunit E [Gammaproteobacteria bacterium]
MNDLRTVFVAGIWRENPALVQLLGLCPLLAITTTLVNGLALGLATTAVLIATNSTVSVIRGALVPAARIVMFVLIIASLVTIVDLLSNAFLHDLHQTLGLFIPLIVTNCAILAQAEVFASRRSPGAAALGGMSTGLGFTGVLVSLGAIREIVGAGTLLSGLDQLVSGVDPGFRIELPFDGMLVAVLPPGAFFGLALLVAVRNGIASKHAREGSDSETRESLT